VIFATLRLVVIFIFRSLGLGFFYLFKKRRKIAEKNVEKALGLSCKPARRLVKDSFRGLGHNLADFLLLSSYNKSNIDKYLTVQNEELIKNTLALKRGLIISTAHFGSWEFAAHALALKGYKSMIVYSKFKKPTWLDSFVKKRREQAGNILVLKNNAFIKLYRHIKNGGITILLTDQHAWPPDGIKVPFLGQEAWTHISFVKMSISAGVPIIPAYLFVDGYSKYTLKFCNPIFPENFANEKDPIYSIALECNKAAESAILQKPSLWMWQHRRFKE
jgi:Kdo2-lipid IVA lauroyltransferase/acyltransferase